MSHTQVHRGAETRVQVDGRTVTVSFELPFMVGDTCFTPYQYTETTVSRIPDIAITLEQNLERVRVSNNGAWYTANHTQVHGIKQFLPSLEALLAFWLDESKREYFENRLGDMRRLFAKDDGALARLQARHVALLQAEIAELKRRMADTMMDTTRDVLALEGAIAKATGSPA